jgi:hypothetical protein
MFEWKGGLLRFKGGGVANLGSELTRSSCVRCEAFVSELNY